MSLYVLSPSLLADWKKNICVMFLSCANCWILISLSINESSHFMGTISPHKYIFSHKWFPFLLASLRWPELNVQWTLSMMSHKDGSVTFALNTPEMRLSLQAPLVHVCLRFTLWCICHFESIWFNLISVPGHPAILCAFSVTVAYWVRPTDSSTNKGV